MCVCDVKQKIYRVNRIKGCHTEHSLPSNVEVKNEQELYVLSPQAPPWHVVGKLFFFKFTDEFLMFTNNLQCSYRSCCLYSIYF
jgi:hypothetical protein